MVCKVVILGGYILTHIHDAVRPRTLLASLSYYLLKTSESVLTGTDMAVSLLLEKTMNLVKEAALKPELEPSSIQ